MEDGFDDDEPVGDEDSLCPTILLTAAEKKALRDPWRKALIIQMFDKGVGYLQLKCRLKSKWALRGDFSLIDIGCEYYVVRFTNMEDYDHVMINGPWMIGDNYLVIREWVANFIPEEDTITKLTAWVRIPKLSVEYFNKSFLFQKIGQKIGRVIKVDSTTENVERGQYTLLCVEVNLTKPLLSKFRLNGRIWGIQYEGVRMICFKCGRQGHKEDACSPGHPETHEEVGQRNSVNRSSADVSVQPECTYGNWMLVKKPTRWNNSRNQTLSTRNRGGGELGEPSQNRGRPELNQVEQEKEMATNLETNQNFGSRFRALADVDPNLETAPNEAEVELDMEANTSNAVGNIPCRTIQVNHPGPEANHYGNRSRGDAEFSPRNRMPNLNTADALGHSDVAQLIHRPSSRYEKTINDGPTMSPPILAIP